MSFVVPIARDVKPELPSMALLNCRGSSVRAQSLTLGLIVVCLSLAPSRDASAEGVGQVLTSKSIPAATVALIDPESGTSSGGSTTDVKVAVGDVILFQFNFSAVPDLRSSGLQGYLTEFVPSNTQVVGVRLIDENGLTIAPRLPGIAQDACAVSCNANTFANLPCTGGAGCSANQVTFQNGSIAPGLRRYRRVLHERYAHGAHAGEPVHHAQERHRHDGARPRAELRRAASPT